MPLLTHISLYTTVLVFPHCYQLQWKKTSYSKKKNSKYKTGVNYSEENKLFKVQESCVPKFTQVTLFTLQIFCIFNMHVYFVNT